LYNPGTATVTVAGLGTATFTRQIGILATFNEASFFGNSAVVISQLVDPDPNNGTGILAQVGDVFLGYDLRGPFGPVSGTGGVGRVSYIRPVFPTRGGLFPWGVGKFFAPPTFAFLATPAPPACTYNLSSSSATAGNSASVGSVQVLTQPGCLWTATSGNTS